MSSSLSLESYFYDSFYVHSNLPNIMHVTTKVHMMLRRSAVLTWMHDNRELVWHVTLWNKHKVNTAIMTMSCLQACGLNSFDGLFNVKTCDIRVGNVTTRREI